MLHVESRGTGDPLLLLHGWGMNLRVFDPLAETLAATHRVIAMDLAGHGRSAWPATGEGFDPRDFDAQARAIADLLPPRCVVTGWSLGGQYALALARLVPEKVRALVLLATTPRFVRAPDWAHGLDAAMLDTFAAQLARNWQATLAEFLALQVRGSREAAEVLGSLRAALTVHGDPRPEALAAGLDHLRDNDLRAAAPGIDVPALAIAGQHDRVTPPGAAQWLAEAMPRGRAATLPRAGHAPFLSHPGETRELIGAFLAELPR